MKLFPQNPKSPLRIVVSGWLALCASLFGLVGISLAQRPAASAQEAPAESAIINEALALGDRARVLEAQSQWVEAVQLRQKMLVLMQERLGADDPRTVMTGILLGNALTML